jgi:hypothetical protein
MDSSTLNIKMTLNDRLIITTPILWLGFVLSISFMEAWLKFQAEGVTIAIGLSLGKLIFFALNKVEIFFMIILSISLFKKHWTLRIKNLVNILVWLLVILLIQTFYLLPILNQRADMIISGKPPAASFFHFYYVFIEVLKVIALIIFSQLTLHKYHG